MSHFLLSLLVALTLPTHLHAQTKKCYFPNGTARPPSPNPQDTWLPCQADGDSSSACCTAGNVCATKGLCQAPHQWNWVWRNGCTDPTFADPACPKYCLNAEQNSTAVLAFQCDETTFCCSTGDQGGFERAYNDSCCSVPELVFKADAISIYKTISVGEVSSSAFSVSSSPASTSTVTSISTVSSTLHSSTTVPTSSPPSISQSAVPLPSKTNSNILAIAAGTSIPIAILCFAVAIFFLIRYHQHRRRRRLDETKLSTSSLQRPLPLSNDPKTTYSTWRAELASPPRELPTEREAQELAGSAAMPGHVPTDSPIEDSERGR
ncbi:hypothetical protein EJ04DRAFT_567800 [Polyplosphaeria fusca]|uniref:Uncharacterized protein n=1 Tax=Polyplosphaeria fusca TaxID=682080 RepID=A0A9P4QMZ9_9PLEO|nr:hypothetical protein EJ04DRAFT_567800 [Polyplosphaeria fusca]